MAAYPALAQLASRAIAGNSSSYYQNIVVPYLLDVWISDYKRRAADTEIVQTGVHGFSYLFDITSERLLSAWGISRGRHWGARDSSRMAGHPLSAGELFHRGHAIAHTLGGPTDINLVPQRGSVNVGPFRVLEKLAVATPGSFYFTYWSYARGASQTPICVDQGLLVPGRPADVRTHPN